MGRWGFLVASAGLLLAGCNGTYADRNPPRVLSDAQIAALRTEVETIGERCRAARLSGQVIGFVGSVHCSNPAILQAYERVDFPYMTLLNIGLAERLQLAERADAKTISEGDMLVQFYSEVRGLPVMPAP
jgi:hypothetical protein